jgi:diacylglycerol kinase family enzyme
MRQVLAEAGQRQADVIVFDPSDGLSQVRNIAAMSPDMLIVWGGDGTHRTALSACAGSFDRLLLLPGGTMNLLTRWLHAQKSWHAVLRSVLQARETRSLHAGEVAGSLFFCAMIAGVPAEVAKAREDIRVGDFGRAMRDVGVALEDAGHLHLTTTIGGEDKAASGNVVAALVGPLAQTQDRMDIVRMNMPANMGALGVAWSLLRSDWHHPARAAQADLRKSLSFTIVDADGRDIPAMMDGEQVGLGHRLTANFRRDAASCLVAARRAHG